MDSNETTLLAGEAVGMLAGLTASAGRAILDIEHALYGFGLTEQAEDGRIVSNTNLFDDTFITRLTSMKNDLTRIYGDLLTNIPGYDDFVAEVDSLKGAKLYGH